MNLKDRLKAQIAATGPMTIAQYMTACLLDPEDGYYATRPRLGADGDFITAPMVSQMFGELIGLWAAEVWAGLGRPPRVRLVEVGPGDGTLIEDALRAAKAAPGFLEAIELVLVEVSEPLRGVQAVRLAGGPIAARWIEGLAALESGPPVILIANEVLDCLPARQFVVSEDGWTERMVGLDEHGELSFRALPPRGGKGWDGGVSGGAMGKAPVGSGAEPAIFGGSVPTPPPLPLPPRGGGIVEVSDAQSAFGFQIGDLMVRDTGGALLVDYGRDAPGYGDTLQALKDHEKVDPLACPGEADLTVHADFPAVLAAARGAGAATSGVLTQGDFLRGLGIEQRAAVLARARPDKTEALSRQLDRLVGDDEMGRLFKAAAVYWPERPVPPAFEET